VPSRCLPAAPPVGLPPLPSPPPLPDGSPVCILYPPLDPTRPLRRPLISSPPPLPHPRTCLLVTGKNSAAPKRTAHSSPQNGGPKGKMIEGRSGGSGRGPRKESRAPPGSLGTSAI